MADLPPESYDPLSRILSGLLRNLRPLTNTADLPVCNTRILREDHGMLWNRRVAVHTTKKGVTNVKAINVKAIRDD